MSWSEGREKTKGPSLNEIREKVKQINAVLEKFSRDEDFHDDLRLPEVQRALKHWTGESRLPTEEALALQDHRRVVYVLQQLQIFTQVCREAGIKVPLHLMLQGAKKLPDAFVRETFGPIWDEETKKEGEKEKKTKPVAAESLPAKTEQIKTAEAKFPNPAPSPPSQIDVNSPISPAVSDSEKSTNTQLKSEEIERDIDDAPSTKTHLLQRELIITGFVFLFAMLVVMFLKKSSVDEL